MIISSKKALNSEEIIGFINGKTEGLGTLITKGLYYFPPRNDLFINWIEYKDSHVEVRDVKKEELYHLQMNTNFTIGTSW